MLARLIGTRQQRRLDTVRREGSPTFRHNFGVLGASGGREALEIRRKFPEARKYEPMDSVVITNRAGESLDVEINGESHSIAPGNTIHTITDTAIWHLALVNNQGTATSSGEVTAVFQRAPFSADKLARLQVS